jgi:hypothetical protein
MYFLKRKSDNGNEVTTVKAVGLGLLLNCGPKSSIERTLFPTDSVKSDSILFSKIISSDNMPLSILKVRLFSLAISKSNTQFVSTNPSRSLTIETSVSSVEIPTVRF